MSLSSLVQDSIWNIVGSIFPTGLSPVRDLAPHGALLLILPLAILHILFLLEVKQTVDRQG